jgi:hypothetical protein
MLDKPLSLNVTFTIPIEIWNLKYDLSRLGQFLGWHFSDFEDGRYPFDTELAKHAIEMAIKNTICQLVSDVEYDKHRGEYVTPDFGGKIAKGCITSEELLKKLVVCIREGMTFAVEEDKE